MADFPFHKMTQNHRKRMGKGDLDMWEQSKRTKHRNRNHRHCGPHYQLPKQRRTMTYSQWIIRFSEMDRWTDGPKQTTHTHTHTAIKAAGIDNDEGQGPRGVPPVQSAQSVSLPDRILVETLFFFFFFFINAIV